MRTVGRLPVVAALAVAVTVLAVGCAATVTGTARAGSDAVVAGTSGTATQLTLAGTVLSGTVLSGTVSSGAVSSDALSSETAASTESSTVLGSNSGPTTAKGSTHRGTASVSDGIITVSRGVAPITIDVYEDPLCPICGAFEDAFGADINDSIDAGKLTVRYRMLTFLDPSSASGDYSTRAFAALLCVASKAGEGPGLFQDFHGALFSSAHQPKERSSTDMDVDQLARLAGSVGASPGALACIRAGAERAAAVTANRSGTAALQQAGTPVGTPTVLKDDKPVKLTNTWLADLVAG